MNKLSELQEEMYGRVTARSFMEELDAIKEAQLQDPIQRAEVRGFWDELEKNSKSAFLADRLHMPELIKRREMQGSKIVLPSAVTPTSIASPKVKSGLGKFVRKLPQTLIKTLTRRG